MKIMKIYDVQNTTFTHCEVIKTETPQRIYNLERHINYTINILPPKLWTLFMFRDRTSLKDNEYKWDYTKQNSHLSGLGSELGRGHAGKWNPHASHIHVEKQETNPCYSHLLEMLLYKGESGTMR